jgi:phosphinothricin acetyltransferase
MTDIKFRPAEVADIPAITEIYKEAVLFGTASFELIAPSKEEMLARFEKLQNSNYPYFVVCEKDKVLGYAYAGAYRERPAYNWTMENSIYMHKDARGKGIGKQLMQCVIDAAKQRGFCQMLANIGGSDNIGSIKLHESLGFQHIGTFPNLGWKFERWHDSVMMQLSLRENDDEKPEKIK